MSSSGSEAASSDTDSDSDSSTSATPNAAGPTKKVNKGRPHNPLLEQHRDLIVRLFTEDKLGVKQISQKINLEYGISRTIDRRLQGWGVPRRNQRINIPTPEMKERIEYHYNKGFNDEQIMTELRSEGFAIMNKRHLSSLRKKLGHRRRARPDELRKPLGDQGEQEEHVEDVTPPPPKKKKPSKKKQPLIPQVTAFVEKYMSAYDGSHDFNHIRRVVGLAHLIYNELVQTPSPVELDLQVLTLAALLHDVGDKKYLEPGQDGNTLVLATLLGMGATETMAIKVQRIVLGVSYSSEVKDPAHVEALITKYPELAVVQDADRLDAIGAIGIGRTFTFGGAKGVEHMGETIQHFEDKLEKLESMMKTEPGKRLARERTERLKTFKGWWNEEQQAAEGLLRRKED